MTHKLTRFRDYIGECSGSEVTEQVFWIGLIVLAVVLLLPQLRSVLTENLESLIGALGS